MILCGAGPACPTTPVYASAAGDTFMIGDAACVTVNETGSVCVPALVVKTIELL